MAPAAAVCGEPLGSPSRAIPAVISWRYQAPARSALSAGALLAGIGGIARNGRGGARSEARVVDVLRARYAPRDVLLTDSGTTALTLALIGVLQDRPGAIALPAYGCYDLATAADGANAAVILYDLDPRTLAPDLAQLHDVLRQGAAAVVVVHLYGHPVDLGDLKRLAAENRALVIEDAAQAMGAKIDRQPAGSQSSLAVLSFGRGKGLTGGRGGGAAGFEKTGGGGGVGGREPAVGPPGWGAGIPPVTRPARSCDPRRLP